MAHDFIKFPELTDNQMELYYFASPHKQILEDFKARVVKVVDGDTVHLEWSERDFIFPLRVAEIQAPEMNEGGEVAKRWLENKVLGAEVDILINKRNRVDKWGRLLGRIICLGVDMGEEEVRQGLAVLWKDRETGIIKDINKELAFKWVTF
jgi:endonuclease YncB( thermonuclease family)